MERMYLLATENEIIKRDSITTHTSFRPFIESNTLTLQQYRSLNNRKKVEEKQGRFLYRKARQQSLIFIDTSIFSFWVDPYINFELGMENGKRLYKNTRGYIARGDIGKNFSFESSFCENQAVFPTHVDSFVQLMGVAPGQGRVKSFKNNGYDFAMASGYVSYSFLKHFNVQAGHGKHFVGDGYRSVLLSDNAFNYPFLRATATFGKWQYTQLYAQLMNMNKGNTQTPKYTEPLYQKKAGSFQLLNYAPFKWLQVGFFQGLMWQAADSMNRQHFNAYYFNPVIGVSTAAYGLYNSNYNVMAGLNIRFNFLKSYSVYLQLAQQDAFNQIDNLQLGFKAYEPFGAKRLFVQVELNHFDIEPYPNWYETQNYIHYNQSLAYPFAYDNIIGAWGDNYYAPPDNVNEVVGIVNYRLHDFAIEMKYNYVINHHDGFYWSAGSYRHIIDTRLIYMINPAANWNLFAGIFCRNYNYSIVAGDDIGPENFTHLHYSQTYLYFGIKTSLSNIYYDF